MFVSNAKQHKKATIYFMNLLQQTHTHTHIYFTGEKQITFSL